MFYGLEQWGGDTHIHRKRDRQTEWEEGDKFSKRLIIFKTCVTEHL